MISASLSRLTSIHPAVTRPTSGQSTPRNKPPVSEAGIEGEPQRAKVDCAEGEKRAEIDQGRRGGDRRAKPAQPKMPQSRMLKAGVL